MMVKTSELSVRPLNWAVAKALDIDCVIISGGVYTEKRLVPLGFSTDWSQGGPILADLITSGWGLAPTLGGVFVSNFSDEGLPYSGEWVPQIREEGPTPLIAACRAIVASKLGNEVDIPDELIQAT